MNRFFYIRLAAHNIRKNAGTYIPYILTCAATIMMFYVTKSLSENPGLKGVYGGAEVAMILNFGVYVIGLFALIFLFYTNSFLMKRRKKEFGLFNILGLEKKHLIRIQFLEALYVTLLSVFLGVLLGIALDKAMFLLIIRLLGVPVTLGFFVSGKVIGVTAVFFCVVFALIFLKSVPMLQFSNPIELLRGGNVGEKEPKTRWFLALLGMVLLGAGYYMSLTVGNPVKAISVTFVAIILVIIATYLLFAAGSIALLKLLKKNQKFYYKARHFISISGMLYRMKQNAVGLANICILSTMVLVMISTTGAMMVGIEDNIRSRYPKDLGVYLRGVDREQVEDLLAEIRRLAEQEQFSVKDEIMNYYLSFSAIQNGNVYDADMLKEMEENEKANLLRIMEDMREVYIVALSDYNRETGEDAQLQADEVLIYYNRQEFNNETIVFFGGEYRVARVLREFPENGMAAMNVFSSHSIVVADETFEMIREKIEADQGSMMYSSKLCYYGFDTEEDRETQKAFSNKLLNMLGGKVPGCQTEIRDETRSGYVALYGGLFFLGVFLGTLFVMAMVLIIYYKQISEGYEDRERFVIMQKVGLSRGEVKAAIRSQVLTVFFLPLLAAGIHVAAAFPLLKALLAILNMVNVQLYAIFTVASFLTFAVFYMLVYGATARTYYRIVSR